MNSVLGIVIVDYHTAEQTVAFVRMQLSLSGLNKKIVIVLVDTRPDELNVLTAGLSCQLVKEDTPVNHNSDIFILSFQQNLGYAKGNNAGAAFLCRYFNPSHICICNNDLNFNNADPFPPLIEKIDSLPHAGVIGPKIHGLDGKDQNPHQYISMVEKYLFRNLLSPFINLFKKTEKYNTIRKNAVEGYYYRLMGCFMLVKTEAFVKCGMFDPNTFLFGEEAILSERMAKAGFKCYYFPGVFIIHEHGKTIRKFFNFKNRLLKEYETDKYYYQTYKGTNNLVTFLALIFLYIYVFLNYFKKNKGG